MFIDLNIVNIRANLNIGGCTYGLGQDEVPQAFSIRREKAQARTESFAGRDRNGDYIDAASDEAVVGIDRQPVSHMMFGDDDVERTVDKGCIRRIGQVDAAGPLRLFHLHYRFTNGRRGRPVAEVIGRRLADLAECGRTGKSYTPELPLAIGMRSNDSSVTSRGRGEF
jgi:hypothetical protein